MRFIDTTKIYVKSGDGGAGCASMRREKFVEFGGPDGGDGGKGGNVYIKGNSGLSTLLDLRTHPRQKAENGKPGMGSQKTGASGKNKVISVPLGTVVINNETEEICFEVLKEESYLLLRGGQGGRGNLHFKSGSNRAPRHAQPGESGKEMWVRLELKLMADVGLVGFPNAGKSTFISAVSNARPKVADYPFTTLIPNLGVVSVSGFRSFVVADIPGIIRNAHQGMGLGDKFLKHIQRTSILAFLIDIAELASHADPCEAFQILLSELELFSPDLPSKKRVILLTKADAVSDSRKINNFILDFKQKGEEVYLISSVARKGLDKVVYRLMELVEKHKAKKLQNDKTVGTP